MLTDLQNSLSLLLLSSEFAPTPLSYFSLHFKYIITLFCEIQLSKNSTILSYLNGNPLESGTHVGQWTELCHHQLGIVDGDVHSIFIYHGSKSIVIAWVGLITAGHRRTTAGHYRTTAWQQQEASRTPNVDEILKCTKCWYVLLVDGLALYKHTRLLVCQLPRL